MEESPLTVIICTRNPRREFLQETLEALRVQTVSSDKWALLIVDNGSTEPLASWLDLSWHPSARVVREEKSGVAHARHRGFREAKAHNTGTILFVDDDNLLDRDYIARGLELGAAWPQLGAWGGQLLPRYEATPPAWIKNYLNYLAITPLTTDLWCNAVKYYDVVPPTAGCFIRASVWQRYLDLIADEPRRLILNRSEDMDLALTAIDLGLGLGRFRDLRLTHIVPASRLTPGYVATLMEGTAIGTGMMEYIRFQKIPRPATKGFIDSTLLRLRTARLPEPLRSIVRADLRGRAAARRIVLGWHTETAARSAPGQLQPAANQV